MDGNQKTDTIRKPARKVKQNGKGSNNGLANLAKRKKAGALARQDLAAIFREQLDKLKVTDQKIAKTIYGALNANVTKVFFDRESGDCVYSTPLIDHTTRLRAAEVAARLKGYEPAKKLDIDADIGFKELTDDELESRITDLIGKIGAGKLTGRAGQKKAKA